MVWCVLWVVVWCSCCFGVMSVIASVVCGVVLCVLCAEFGRWCCDFGFGTMGGGGVSTLGEVCVSVGWG